jgi:hypothetical protein
MLMFQLITFLLHFFVLWTELEPKCAEGVNGNASSVLNEISCHCCCVNQAFHGIGKKLLLKQFHQQCVESSFQSLLDLDGAGGAV